MEFVMIVEPDEVETKKIQEFNQTENASYSYHMTVIPAEPLDR